jgi:DeoR family fructose operon transcriptional repressor
MGSNGFSLSRGATTPDIGTAQTKKLMISMASSVIVVCDSSKLRRDSFAQFASLDEIDILITETCEHNIKVRLEEQGINVIAADTERS